MFDINLVKSNEQPIRTIPPEIITEWLWVTPDVARKLLDLNSKNRTPEKKRITHYVDCLKNGTFVDFSTDAIAVYDDNTLANGQHRLTAIVETEVSVWMLIVCNIPKEVGQILDQGKKRTSSDIFELMTGRKKRSIEYFSAWKDDSEKFFYGLGNNSKFTPPKEIAEFMIKNQQVLDELARKFDNNHCKMTGLCETRIRAAFLDRILKDEEQNNSARRLDILSMADKLATNNLSVTDPLKIFLEWYLQYQVDMDDKDGYVDSHLVYATLLNCLDAQIENRQITAATPFSGQHWKHKNNFLQNTAKVTTALKAKNTKKGKDKENATPAQEPTA